MSDTASSVRKPLVKKGGTRYPKYRLEDALPWARKLVSRTHTSPQPEAVIFAAVVESRGSTADIKVSSLRQYGLLDGKSSAYLATDLAKQIANSPAEDLLTLYAQAALAPPIFKGLYETFGASEVAKAQLKRRAGDLHVHPDSLDECIDMYLSALSTAGLVRLDGDKIVQGEVSATPQGEGKKDVEERRTETGTEQLAEDVEPEIEPVLGRRGRSVVNVTLNLDSSLDPEKLEKQLALLKRYGAI